MNSGTVRILEEDLELGSSVCFPREQEYLGDHGWQICFRNGITYDVKILNDNGKVISRTIDKALLVEEPAIPNTLSSTKYTCNVPQAEIDAKVEEAFAMLTSEQMDEEFEGEYLANELLYELLESHPEPVLDALYGHLKNSQTRPSIIKGVLNFLGYVDNDHTHEHRRRILEEMLQNGLTPATRDTANIGLSLINDPKSIPALEKAKGKETNDLVKRYIDQTLEQLRRVKNAGIDPSGHI
ncbi:MAG: hypothetical protein JW828_04190 [Sedimentisphaerales bacterium]|nr:hypothetical protein [Sedimentisphaerales bacterium]